MEQNSWKRFEQLHCVGALKKKKTLKITIIDYQISFLNIFV